MAKPSLTLEELIASQKELAKDQNKTAQSQERISVSQLKTLINIEGLTRQARNLQAVSDIEEKRMKDSDDLIVEDLQRGLLDKNGDGLNSNVIKMAKSLDKLTKLFEEQKKTASTLEKVGERREFKTIGQRVVGVKENVKDFFTMRGFLDKTGIVKRGTGGIFSEALDAREDRQKYARARIEAGDPTVRLHGKEGARKIFENQRNEQQKLVREKNQLEDKLAEYGRLNVPDKQIASSPESKRLAEVAKKFEKFDPSVRGHADKVDHSIVSRNDNLSESDIEQSKFQNDELEVLRQIEENTRPDNKGKPAEKEGKSGGLLSGLGKGLKGAAGALGDAAKGMLAFAASLWIISKAFNNFADLSWGGIIKGIVAMGAFTVAIQYIKSSDAAKTLVGFGTGLWLASKGFQNFAEINWSGILKGVIAIGAMVVAVKALEGVGFKGALVMGAMALALWGLSKAINTFAEVDWGTMLKAGVTIAALAAGMTAIGALAPEILLGAAAVGAIALAVWGLGKALQAMGEGLDKMISGIERLANVGGLKLLEVAAGITAIGAAMIAFGAAEVVAGLENLVANFLSIGQDSPVEQLEKIGQAGPGIEKAADGMEKLANAIKTFADIDEDVMENTVDAIEDISKSLKDLPEKSMVNIVTGTANFGTDASAPPKTAAANAAPANATPSKATPLNKASMTNIEESHVSATLTGVTGDQIRNHPNFKKYYDQALKDTNGDKTEAWDEASMLVKDDMAREQVKPTSPKPQSANKVYNKSAENAANDQASTPNANQNIVNAPTQINNQQQHAVIKPQVRNQDNTLTSYLRSKFAM